MAVGMEVMFKRGLDGDQKRKSLCILGITLNGDLHQVNWMQDMVNSTSQYRHLTQDFIFHHFPMVQMLSNFRER